jgi:hypothetical protein
MLFRNHQSACCSACSRLALLNSRGRSMELIACVAFAHAFCPCARREPSFTNALDKQAAKQHPLKTYQANWRSNIRCWAPYAKVELHITPEKERFSSIIVFKCTLHLRNECWTECSYGRRCHLSETWSRSDQWVLANSVCI